MSKTKAFTRISLSLVIIFLISAQCNRSSISKPDLEATIGPHYGLVYYSASINSPGYAGVEFGGLYLFDLITKETTRLTEGNVVSQYERFSWSSITRKLVYTARGDNVFNENLLELYSLDLKGESVQLTHNNFSDGDAFVSPNGQTIAFWSSRPDHHWLYLMNPDGSNLRPFFENNPGLEYGTLPLVWSPDSQKLAIPTIILEEDLPINLNDVQYSFQVADFGSKKVLAPLLSDDRVRINVNWSADSKKLAYLSDPIKLSQFQTMYTTLNILNINTRKETLITEFAAITPPYWSPINDVIAFSASTEKELYATGEFNVYLISSDGTNLKRITNGGFFNVASWSPDGSKLALELVGEQLIDDEIYIFDIASGILEQITDNNVLDAYPIWVELE